MKDWIEVCGEPEFGGEAEVDGWVVVGGGTEVEVSFGRGGRGGRFCDGLEVGTLWEVVEELVDELGWKDAGLKVGSLSCEGGWEVAGSWERLTGMFEELGSILLQLGEKWVGVVRKELLGVSEKNINWILVMFFTSAISEETD